jgi:hypothetical protein
VKRDSVQTYEGETKLWITLGITLLISCEYNANNLCTTKVFISGMFKKQKKVQVFSDVLFKKEKK